MNKSKPNQAKLKIEGPVSLRGHVGVRGAKNAALPIIVAAAATSDTVILDNVPTDLIDVQLEVEGLRCIGSKVKTSDGSLEITTPEITETELPPEISGRLRSSLIFLGLLVGKNGRAKISFPGGCNLGDRKFDLHLEGLKQLGANIELTEHSVEVTADRLKGNDIQFYLPTTTGTETVMLAACFAEGRTRIFNANTRPEVADMAACLNAMGAKITVKNRIVEIEGPTEFSGCRHSIMSGWDEALTYIIAAGISHSEICIDNFSFNYIKNDVQYLRDAGVDIFEWGGNVYVSAKDRELKPFDLFTAPYPGINSDMQPIFAAFGSQCHGESSVTDQRFTERFQYISEFKKLGMPIESYGNCAVVNGPANLIGATVKALDLRCGAALILSALTAVGTTIIEQSQQIDRGYEYIVSRMRNLGVDISRIVE